MDKKNLTMEETFALAVQNQQNTNLASRMDTRSYWGNFK